MNFLDRLKNQVVLDTETLGLRPTGMHQLAWLDIDTGVINEVLFKPYRVESSAGGFQDQAQMRDLGQFRTIKYYSDWKQALKDEYPTGVPKFIKSHLPVWSHMDLDAQRRERELSKHGQAHVQVAGPEWFKNFHRRMAGKTIWIANVPFEAAQIGSVLETQLSADEQRDFSAAFETQRGVRGQLNVTGVQIQHQRALAQITGDWRPVWEAYRADLARDTDRIRVRDIQDVIRSIFSYGKAEGLTDAGPYLGTNMDIVNRLMKSIDTPGAWMLAEAHVAGEDTVLERGVLGEMLTRAEELHSGDTRWASEFFKRFNIIQDDLKERNLAKRLGRATQDILEHGKSRVTIGRTRGRNRRIREDGVAKKIARVDYVYRDFTTLEDLGAFLETQGYRREMIAEQLPAFKALMQRGGSPAQVDNIVEDIVGRVNKRLFTDEMAVRLEGYRGYLLAGDVHARPELSKAIIEEAQRLNRKALFIGDIFDGPGGAAGSVDVLRQIRSSGSELVLGNHELHLLFSSTPDELAAAWGEKPGSAKAKDIWRQSQELRGLLTQDELSWLKSRPLYVTGDGWMAVHAKVGAVLPDKYVAPGAKPTDAQVHLVDHTKPKGAFWAESYAGEHGHVYFGHTRRSKLGGKYEFEHATLLDWDAKKQGTAGVVIPGGKAYSVLDPIQSRPPSPRVQQAVKTAKTQAAAQVSPGAFKAPGAKVALAFAAVAGLLSFGGAVLGEKPEHQGSLIYKNYRKHVEEWEAWDEHAQHAGVAGEMRADFTDFGSPYTGPKVIQRALNKLMGAEIKGSDIVLEASNKIVGGYTGDYAHSLADEWREWDNYAQHAGVAGEMRPQFTDFGSPYRGPVVSSQVLMDTDERRRRDDWLMNQYGVRSFSASDRDFWDPFFNYRSNVMGYMPRGYQYMSVQKEAENRPGIRPGKGVEVDLDGFHVEALDADTLRLRRKTWLGSLTAWTQPVYNVRVAGIDAPETAHGSQEAQPFADMATNIARDIVRQPGAKLILDADQTTYGRMVGTVVTRETNLSHQLIQQGAAAALRYGKDEDALMDFKGLAARETRAISSRKGMWADQYYLNFRQLDPENKVTFSQLHDPRKRASSLRYMTMHAAMESRQEYNWSQEASILKKNTGPGGDFVSPGYRGLVTAPSKSIAIDQARQAASFRPGKQQAQNRFRQAGDYGRINTNTMLDTTRMGTSAQTRQDLGSFDAYKAKQQVRAARRARQAQDQRQALAMLNESPIQHHRMR